MSGSLEHLEHRLDCPACSHGPHAPGLCAAYDLNDDGAIGDWCACAACALAACPADEDGCPECHARRPHA